MNLGSACSLNTKSLARASLVMYPATMAMLQAAVLCGFYYLLIPLRSQIEWVRAVLLQRLINYTSLMLCSIQDPSPTRGYHCAAPNPSNPPTAGAQALLSIECFHFFSTGNTIPGVRTIIGDPGVRIGERISASPMFRDVAFTA